MSNKKGTRVLIALTVLLALSAFGMWVAAIWVVGDNSQRLGATGLLVLFVAMASGLAAAAWDELS